MEIDIRPYTDVDKLAVLSLIKLNTPLYFAESEAMDFAHYLDHEKEMYFVACIDGEVVGCGGVQVATLQAAPPSTRWSRMSAVDA